MAFSALPATAHKEDTQEEKLNRYEEKNDRSDVHAVLFLARPNLA